MSVIYNYGFAWQLNARTSAGIRRSNMLLNLMNTSYLENLDFILVYEDQAIFKPDANKKIDTFLSSLEENGLIVETCYSSVVKNATFLKIHAPLRVLEHLSVVYDVDLEYHNHNYIPDTSVYFQFMETPLTVPNAGGKYFDRAPFTLSGQRPTEITQAERSLIIYKLMSETWYGTKIDEYGISEMLKLKLFDGAFPPHEGSWKWTDEGPLSDRQLLDKYWASINMIHKQQPLNLIQRYFGSQIAFYFAFLGFYNKMLIPAAIIGLIFFLFGFYFLPIDSRIKEVCTSNIILCPVCGVHEVCNFLPLYHACGYTKLSVFFDNYTSIGFAALMTIWSTIFFELWKQEEIIYIMKWNLMSVHLDSSIRNEYLANAHGVRISKVTGNTEPFVKNNIFLIRYGLSYVSMILMVLILSASMISLVVYRLKLAALAYTIKSKYVKDNLAFVVSFTGSLFTVFLINFFIKLFSDFSVKLTVMECHRTQTSFENSLIYKSFLLAFAVNFSFLFYLAFFKENFYTYPSDKRLNKSWFSLRTDRCSPAGCLVDLSVQLFCILAYHNFKNNVVRVFSSFSNVQLNRLKKKKEEAPKTKEIWERDYFLNPIDRDQIIKDYVELIMQYSAVTFFVAAFPLAPLFALLNNIINIRLQAMQYTRTSQRTVAHRVRGLGAWNVIIKSITFIGVTTNTWIIAFASDTLPKFINYLRNTKDHAYIKRHYSRFNVSDFGDVDFSTNVTECYYRGKRYPPSHPNRYELTANFWEETVMKLVFVFIFEHMIIALKTILMKLIPDIPFLVQEKLNYQERKIKGTKKKILNEDYLHPDKNETRLYISI